MTGTNTINVDSVIDSLHDLQSISVSANTYDDHKQEKETNNEINISGVVNLLLRLKINSSLKSSTLHNLESQSRILRK